MSALRFVACLVAIAGTWWADKRNPPATIRYTSDQFYADHSDH